MKTAQTITNRYQDFKVLNLCQLIHHVEGRGPFMVTQDGNDPNDPARRHCSFVLTKRGTWLHFYLYLALPEAVRQKLAYYESVPEVMQQADSLPTKVVVEDVASLQELIREAGFEPAAEDAAGRALLQEITKRHALETKPSDT